MHDLEGLFCKTGKSWDNAKFAGPGKNISGRICWASSVQERALGWGAHHGLQPVGEEAEGRPRRRPKQAGLAGPGAGLAGPGALGLRRCGGPRGRGARGMSSSSARPEQGHGGGGGGLLRRRGERGGVRSSGRDGRSGRGGSIPPGSGGRRGRRRATATGGGATRCGRERAGEGWKEKRKGERGRAAAT